MGIVFCKLDFSTDTTLIEGNSILSFTLLSVAFIFLLLRPFCNLILTEGVMSPPNSD